MALLEVCCGNLESVDAAVSGGARRIELCASLELDGLTPPASWIRETKARYPSLIVHVLIRPRAGGFVYTREEADTMAGQVEEALQTGADGIVIGALTPSGEVDVSTMEQLMRGARVSTTFHRAFDVCRRPFDALEELVSLGFDRILTSGQAPTAVEGADLLRELRQRALGRIGILPGGGVSPQNAARILSLTGCTEIHASASVSLDGKRITSAGIVSAILQSINEI